MKYFSIKFRVFSMALLISACLHELSVSPWLPYWNNHLKQWCVCGCRLGTGELLWLISGLHKHTLTRHSAWSSTRLFWEMLLSWNGLNFKNCSFSFIFNVIVIEPIRQFSQYINIRYNGAHYTKYTFWLALNLVQDHQLCNLILYMQGMLSTELFALFRHYYFFFFLIKKVGQKSVKLILKLALVQTRLLFCTFDVLKCLGHGF